MSIKEKIVFSKEEYNKHIEEIIKNTLNNAANTQKEYCMCKKEECNCSEASNQVIRAILNTFEKTFKKHKIG